MSKSAGEELSDLIGDIVQKERDLSHRYILDLQRQCAKTTDEFRELQREIATLREVMKAEAWLDLVRRAKAER